MSTAHTTSMEDVIPQHGEDERKVNVARYAVLLLVACVIGLISNWVGTGTSPLTALPGMVVLYLLSVAGIVMARFIPLSLPGVAWTSLLAILVTVPAIPGSAWVLAQVEALNFLALATPALAYGGLALTKGEFDIARRSGWKIVIVAICVMFGTYIGSVIIADISLRLTGM
ncbi:hypothetical protein HGO37_23040 [Rhizobium sp. CG4]|jgi:hypothetical protein|uniref:hypothetical protein n=1 Tax=Rhizobium/Agrobacterium group TaxID=227290 RepID=UPI0017815A70|nr:MULTISPECIES: hypothetical protein [Rhizobium/Agrobacterium group]MBD9390081.1 hypothetical protein [Agrobacterium sp. AGB01]MCM2458274.1 hypothetical protein [Rhizobium sp. CG4]MCS4242505.1 hypothetical protein [Rhizobium sp. BIGb0125]MDO5895755.1 hypothetical protein [Agrobacterium sp. Azo12]